MVSDKHTIQDQSRFEKVVLYRSSLLKQKDTSIMGFNDSFIGKFFEMEERKTDFMTELKGACATFLTLAYILAVNPAILSDSGGPCVPDADGVEGLAYQTCVQEVKKEYITATAIASLIGCKSLLLSDIVYFTCFSKHSFIFDLSAFLGLLMGLMANLPIALAPGMGLNAYFT